MPTQPRPPTQLELLRQHREQLARQEIIAQREALARRAAAGMRSSVVGHQAALFAEEHRARKPGVGAPTPGAGDQALLFVQAEATERAAGAFREKQTHSISDALPSGARAAAGLPVRRPTTWESALPRENSVKVDPADREAFMWLRPLRA